MAFWIRKVLPLLDSHTLASGFLLAIMFLEGMRNERLQIRQEELLEAISNEIANAGLVESQVELEFTVTADGCVPVITSEFLDALYGGVFRLYDDMLNSN